MVSISMCFNSVRLLKKLHPVNNKHGEELILWFLQYRFPWIVSLNEEAAVTKPRVGVIGQPA
jgi:hypothetical protein